jgi:hypothetical protein
LGPAASFRRHTSASYFEYSPREILCHGFHVNVAILTTSWHNVSQDSDGEIQIRVMGHVRGEAVEGPFVPNPPMTI